MRRHKTMEKDAVDKMRSWKEYFGVCTKASVVSLLAAVAFCAFLGISAFGVDVGQFVTPPRLNAKAAVLLDADTGQLLYGLNEHEKLPCASLTKLMTCLLALEYGRYGETTQVTAQALSDVGGSTVLALSEGEEITLDSLLYGMMSRSANDAANAVAIHIGGSMGQFAERMNRKAAELGAVNSRFRNPSGLPLENQYSSAYDLGLITKALYAYPEFTTYAGARQTTLPPTNLFGERIVTNLNAVFASDTPYEGAFLGKTGWTVAAGQCLMTMAKRNGTTLICVVLNAGAVNDGEFADTKALFDYGFNAFRRVTIPAERFPVQQVTYIDENGVYQAGELVFREKEMSFLLGTGIFESDVDLHTVVPSPLYMEKPERLRLELRLPEVAGEVMYTTAGTYPLDIQPIVLATDAVPVEEPFDWFAFWRAVGISAGAGIVVAGLGLFTVKRVSLKMYRTILSSKLPHNYWSDDEIYFLTKIGPTQEEMDELRIRYKKKLHLFGVTAEDFWIVAQAAKAELDGRILQKKLRQQRRRQEAKLLAEVKALGGDVEANMSRLAQGYSPAELKEKQEKSMAEYQRLRDMGEELSSPKAKQISSRSWRPFDKGG